MSNQIIDPIQDHLDYVLRKFCKSEVSNPEFSYMLAPFRCNGLCVAADSHVGLAIDPNLFPILPDYPEHDATFVNKLYASMDAAEDVEAYALDDLEALCDECEEQDEIHFIYLAPDAFRVQVIRRVILAARLLGASSIIVPTAKEAGSMRVFSLAQPEGNGHICAYGCFMPMRPGSADHLLPAPQAILMPDSATINLEDGMKFRIDMEAAQEQARKEYEASQKVFLVTVCKYASIPVVAVSPQAAMELASKHCNEVDDDLFEDSDIGVDSCNTYPETDESVETLSERHEHKHQGILTDDGFIPWSKYYGEDDPEDDFHKNVTSIRLTFGK